MCMSAAAAVKLSSRYWDEIVLRESQGLKVNELTKAQQLAEEHRGLSSEVHEQLG